MKDNTAEGLFAELSEHGEFVKWFFTKPSEHDGSIPVLPQWKGGEGIPEARGIERMICAGDDSK